MTRMRPRIGQGAAPQPRRRADARAQPPESALVQPGVGHRLCNVAAVVNPRPPSHATAPSHDRRHDPCVNGPTTLSHP